jgi:hypothetical protein
VSLQSALAYEGLIPEYVPVEPAADTPAWLDELRLQNLDLLDLAELHRLAEASGKPKLRRAAGQIAERARAEAAEYRAL